MLPAPLLGLLGLVVPGLAWLAWAWALGVLLALAYDAWRIPRASELEFVRELPKAVGLDQDFERRLVLTLDLVRGPRAGAGADERSGRPRRAESPRTQQPEHGALAGFGRMAIELHERAPAALRPVRPGAARSGEQRDDLAGEPAWVELDELEIADGERLVVARDGELLADDDAPGAPARCRLTFTRRYRPRRRGVLRLGRVVAWITGPLGLLRLRREFEAAQELIVEPAMMGLSRTLALVASDRWQDLGLARVRHLRGGQTEFESLRDYVLGDEPRSIDWKAFARRGKPMVRQYEPERGQELILMFDCGRRMTAPVHDPDEPSAPIWSKLDHALDAGLQFAAVVLSQGDRVGCMAFGARPLAFVAPARSGRQLTRLKQAVFDIAPTTLESDLGGALAELAVRHRRKAMVVVLSDLADPDHVEEQARALSRVRRSRVVFAAFDDPDLLAASRDRDPEAAALRAAALAELAERRRGIALLRSKGVRVIDLPAARSAGPLLAAWFQERRSL